MVKCIPRVLVITMYCGEPQIERCLSSVKEQEGVSCTHTLIKNKSNVEAHRELYELINNDVSHDFYIKLDADMEFSSAQSICTLISFFKNSVDYITIPVFDFFTNTDMPALHMYNSKVTFDLGNMDNLYVDNVKVNYLGYRRDIRRSRKIVYHCCSPSNAQAFAFGIHRSLKVCQRNRGLVNLDAARYHFNTLRKVYTNYSRQPDFKELSYVLFAAKQVFEGKYNETMEKKNEYMNSFFLNIEMTDYSIFKKNSLFALLEILGYRRLLKGVFFYMYTKAKRAPSKLRSLLRQFRYN